MVYFMKSMFHLRLWFFCWIIYTNNSDSVFFGNPPKRSEHQFPLKSLKYSIYTLWSSNMAGWDIPTNYSGYKMLYLYIYIPYILSIDYPILFYHHVDLNVNHFKDLSIQSWRESCRVPGAAQSDPSHLTAKEIIEWGPEMEGSESKSC